jgi:hypothetical protein
MQIQMENRLTKLEEVNMRSLVIAQALAEDRGARARKSKGPKEP